MRAKRKPATKTKRSPGKAPSDTPLINECVRYAQEMAAFHAGFKADPDGSSKHAAGLGNRHERRAKQALTKIATMKASTPTGLDAKARILPVVIQDDEGSMESASEVFYRTFAADVRAFLDHLVHADWFGHQRRRLTSSPRARGRPRLPRVLPMERPAVGARGRGAAAFVISSGKRHPRPRPNPKECKCPSIKASEF
jgi:hypothetical protein